MIDFPDFFSHMLSQKQQIKDVVFLPCFLIQDETALQQTKGDSLTQQFLPNPTED